MALAASVIIDRVETVLLDSTNVRWTAAELLDYLNAGITAIVSIKPDSSVFVGSFTLANASSKQTIPSDGTQFLKVSRNLSPATSVITQVEENHLNHAKSDWHNTVGTPAHFVFDPRLPNKFYIYPQPASGTNTVELAYVQIPTRLASAASTIPFEDGYETPLFYYTIAFAYAKNAKRGDIMKANSYMNLFYSFFGIKTPTQFQFSPNTPLENSLGSQVKAQKSMDKVGGVDN